MRQRRPPPSMARQRNVRRNRYWDVTLHRQEDAEALMLLSRHQSSDRRHWAGTRYVIEACQRMMTWRRYNVD